MIEQRHKLLCMFVLDILFPLILLNTAYQIPLEFLKITSPRNKSCQKMYNLFLHSLTSPPLKTIDKCQRYDHFIARGSDFKNDYYKKPVD